MTAILSQMDDRHYATYIETFTKTSELVVSVETLTHWHTNTQTGEMSGEVHPLVGCRTS